MGQRSQHVHFRQSQRRPADALRLTGNRRPQVGEQPPLDLRDLFLCVENLGFIFLQFRSGEALRAHQRLLALIVLRSEMQIRLRNLDVVTKDRIELNLQRSNARPLPLPLFHLRQHLLAVATQVAQLVKLAIHARSDHATISDTQGRFGNDRGIDALPKLAQFIEGPVKSLQSLRTQAAHSGLDCGNPPQRCRESKHIAWIRCLQRYAAE